ncbi:MAG: hypothetical protein AB3N23_15500 [Paracoccaceae bacterium]
MTSFKLKPAATLAATLVLSHLTASAAIAQDLSFTIFNASTASLVEFNVSPASSGDWEDNLLRGAYLAPDYEIDVVIADGLSTCVYDIRGIFDDGSTVEDYALDLCGLGEYTFED